MNTASANQASKRHLRNVRKVWKLVPHIRYNYLSFPSWWLDIDRIARVQVKISLGDTSWCLSYHSINLINRCNPWGWPLFLPSVVILIKGPVHINAFSFENAYISMRLGLLSTLIRCSFSSKTLLKMDHGSKRMHTYRIGVDSRKRWPKLSQARVFVACI